MATLDEQYLQIIADQRTNLVQLQENFNKSCDQITLKYQTQLQQIPIAELDNRKKVLEAQKKDLDEALKVFKTAVDKSSHATREALENIHRQREAQKLEQIEKELLNLK